MFDVFGSLRDLVRPGAVCIDDRLFRLHSHLTVTLLVAASALVSCRQYFGDPIHCIQRDDVPEQVLETFCWVHTTFTLPEAWGRRVGVEVPHPGVDKHTPGQRRVHHAYYQWVCFVLFLQALLFYAPRHLWKGWERGTADALTRGLRHPDLEDAAGRRGRVALLAASLRARLGTHGAYAGRYALCELLNLANVLAQIHLIDAFLGGEFSTTGVGVLALGGLDQPFRTDPLVRVFPRMTKCTFHRYGSSGDVQRHDALCMLPLNILNEKIYVMLWFWLLALAVLTAAGAGCRALLVLWPETRYLVLRARCRLADRRDLHALLARLPFSDWFLLQLLCKNMDPLPFRELVRELARELKGGERLLEKAVDF